MHIAQAWDRKTAEMVYVLSVQGGEWLVRGQWSGQEGTREFADLRAIWPEHTYLDNIDEMHKAGMTPLDLMHILDVFLDNHEWTVIVLATWADLY